MSTKTLRKRVALGTVVALGAGLLSLVSVSSANASSADLTVGVNGATGAVLSASVPNSAGLLGTASTTGTTMTATLLSTGTLSVFSAASSTNSVVTVTGGTITAVVGSDNLSADRTLAGAATAAMGLEFQPNAGVTTMIIQTFKTATATTSSSGGTLVASLVVTIAGTSVAGVFSASKSLINTATIGSPTNAGVDVVNATTGSSTVIPNRASAYINFTLNDAYGIALSSGPMTVSATGGAVVVISSHC